MTASAPAIENSYMLPHGGRPADSPRVTHRAQVQREGQHGQRRPRSARAGRRASGRASPAPCSASAGLRRSRRRRRPRRRSPTRAPDRCRRRRPARTRRRERELGGVAEHGAGVDHHRGVEQVVAEVRQALAGHSVLLVAVARVVGPALAGRSRRSSSASSRDLVGEPVAVLPSVRARPATSTSVRPPPSSHGPHPDPAAPHEQRRASGRPARAAPRPARARLPGSCATCSVAHRRTPSKVIAARPSAASAAARAPAPAPAACRRRRVTWVISVVSSV